MNPQVLLALFKRNGEMVRRNVAELTHENSLWTPAANVNSLNWLLGHLVAARTSLLMTVGQTPVWDETVRARYSNGSEPINGDGDGVRTLETLLADFEESQRRLEAGLAAAAPELLDGPAIQSRFPNALDHFLYLYGHEIQHIGHIMTLRELLGLPTYWAPYERVS